MYGPEDLDTDACLRQRVVYFDFDQDALRPEFQAAMACHAKYLRDRPSSRMSLEGNADERGSREYNLGLGERRGNAVSSALQANGGGGSQITVVSYGEERPTCTSSSVCARRKASTITSSTARKAMCWCSVMTRRVFPHSAGPPRTCRTADWSPTSR